MTGRAGRLPLALVGLLRRRGIGGLRSAVWTVRALRTARTELARRGLDTIRLPSPPSRSRNADQDIVLRVLRRRRATCLERSLVLQRWYAHHQVRRTLVIGVTAPSAGFHAHAWLDGDTDAEREAMVEILRRAPPVTWLTGTRHDR